MNNYRLSDCQRICKRHYDNRCVGCEFLEGYYAVSGGSECFFGDNRPYSWDIKTATKAKVIDRERIYDLDNWIYENAREYWESYCDSFGDLHNGDTVEILMNAPIGIDTPFADENDLLFLVRKGEAMNLIHEDGLEIIKE